MLWEPWLRSRCRMRLVVLWIAAFQPFGAVAAVHWFFAGVYSKPLWHRQSSYGLKDIFYYSCTSRPPKRMHQNWPLALTICVKKDRERKGTLGKQARKGDTLRDHWGDKWTRGKNYHGQVTGKRHVRRQIHKSWSLTSQPKAKQQWGKGDIEENNGWDPKSSDPVETGRQSKTMPSKLWQHQKGVS